VSKPVHLGGLGFGFKWDMGWMHDTLSYFSRDPIHRSFHHNELTFRSVYGYSENYVLPLSHDEVVYGKGSLLAKMPGDSWQRFAGLRLLLSYMFATPGKKLLFMGAEFGQWNEWYHENSLDWHLLDEEKHRSLRLLVGTLNHLYATEKALFEGDCEPGGFQWVDCNDSAGSILSFLRIDRASKEPILAVCNFTPVTRKNYRIGVDSGPYWRELLNSDAAEFGGSGQGNMGMAEFNPVPCHGREGSVVLTLPPLAALYLKREGSP
ncbi:MAG: alpha amylase C-terminal domain-containing protein, partial [Acidobacteriota bacterium]